MAIGVDTSTWKPRKIKGTPAAKATTILASGILGFGVLCGAWYQCSNVTSKFRTALNVFYEDPEEEVERKQLIASGLPLKSGSQIREMKTESERVDQPDK